MTKWLTVSLAFCFVSALASAAVFDCKNLQCTSNTEYCLLTQNSKGKVYYNRCFSLRVGEGCDWAKKDALKQLADVENCKHKVECDSNGSGVTVKCTWEVRKN